MNNTFLKRFVFLSMCQPGYGSRSFYEGVPAGDDDLRLTHHPGIRSSFSRTKETHNYARHGVQDRVYHAEVDYRPSEQWHQNGERGRSGRCEICELDKPPSPKIERPASARSVKEYYKPSRNTPRGPDRASPREIRKEAAAKRDPHRATKRAHRETNREPSKKSPKEKEPHKKHHKERRMKETKHEPKVYSVNYAVYDKDRRHDHRGFLDKVSDSDEEMMETLRNFPGRVESRVKIFKKKISRIRTPSDKASRKLSPSDKAPRIRPPSDKGQQKRNKVRDEFLSNKEEIPDQKRRHHEKDWGADEDFAPYERKGAPEKMPGKSHLMTYNMHELERDDTPHPRKEVQRKGKKFKDKNYDLRDSDRTCQPISRKPPDRDVRNDAKKKILATRQRDDTASKGEKRVIKSFIQNALYEKRTGSE
ncbi:hypothetical protein CDAR_117781 [Caerostris darwini]|uniref:Uncharacterized protein n=1 Tax=Caerostris darwini TaxID=1538125 RepID=A0AAV4PXM5_9ARAC|nr:hypothetical protein CDAR_117781 [Caerostris darwini]